MIHILTLTWNGLDKLQRLRPGLIRNLEKLNVPYTWYIRDNGSKDGTLDEISTWDNVKILSIDHNRDNFAQGVNSLRMMVHETMLKQNSENPISNIAVKSRSVGFISCLLVSNDIYLLLNNDVEFIDDNSLHKMYSLMTPDVGIVGARLLYNNTSKLQHAGVIFGDRYGKMPYHYRHQELSDDIAKKNRYFQAVTAAVCMVRASDLDNIGGMDEKFNWAFEDIDMNLRIGQLEHKIVYCGETNIYHEESASLKKNPMNKMFIGSNIKYFKSKWFDKYEIDHDKYLTNPHYNEV